MNQGSTNSKSEKESYQSYFQNMQTSVVFDLFPIPIILIICNKNF